MKSITDINASEILDSRGAPTLEVTVVAGDARGSCKVPSGASVGSHEAFVLRDADGGMDACMQSIEELRMRLIGADVENQKAIDLLLKEIDGTATFSRLGGNVLVGISIAVAKAAAASRGEEFYSYLATLLSSQPAVPRLYMNYLNGGKHAVTPIAFQEYMIVPRAGSVRESLDIAHRFEVALRDILAGMYGLSVAESLGDEGGFVLPQGSVRTPLQLFTNAAAAAGVEESIQFALDVAASSFFRSDAYDYDSAHHSADELHMLLTELAKEFPLVSIEDPFYEEAVDDFVKLHKAIEVKIIGDDLTVTSASRIREMASCGAISGVIIKANQIGTLTDTLEAITEARTQGIAHIVSHRSGETMDDFIADLAFASGAFGLKAGTPRKKERLVKYDRLRAITE